MTWTYNGVPGKRARLRDMGLWVVDGPAYYREGSFVTVDLQLPEVRRRRAAAAACACLTPSATSPRQRGPG
jgi:hypothetical protein